MERLIQLFIAVFRTRKPETFLITRSETRVFQYYNVCFKNVGETPISIGDWTLQAGETFSDGSELNKTVLTANIIFGEAGKKGLQIFIDR